ncbi:MAG: hypothetical protein WBM50_26515 [Acidimicrobiales bacterium]
MNETVTEPAVAAVEVMATDGLVAAAPVADSTSAVDVVVDGAVVVVVLLDGEVLDVEVAVDVDEPVVLVVEAVVAVVELLAVDVLDGRVVAVVAVEDDAVVVVVDWVVELAVVDVEAEVGVLVVTDDGVVVGLVDGAVVADVRGVVVDPPSPPVAVLPVAGCSSPELGSRLGPAGSFTVTVGPPSVALVSAPRLMAQKATAITPRKATIPNSTGPNRKRSRSNSGVGAIDGGPPTGRGRG